MQRSKCTSHLLSVFFQHDVSIALNMWDRLYEFAL